jgi:peptidoglycan-associated lipoprotein
MIRTVLRLILIAGVVGLLVVPLGGCSKKEASAEVDPNPPAPPPTAEREQTPPPSPPPADDDGNAWKLQIKDVYFDFDKYELRGDARSTLQENARYLKENRGASVVLEGHCDERGTDEYNLALGQRRADAVKAYLIDLGVSGSQLSTISYGEERPFATAHDESGWSQNRRVHFKL